MTGDGHTKGLPARSRQQESQREHYREQRIVGACTRVEQGPARVARSTPDRGCRCGPDASPQQGPVVWASGAVLFPILLILQLCIPVNCKFKFGTGSLCWGWRVAPPPPLRTGGGERFLRGFLVGAERLPETPGGWARKRTAIWSICRPKAVAPNLLVCGCGRGAEGVSCSC